MIFIAAMYVAAIILWATRPEVALIGVSGALAAHLIAYYAASHDAKKCRLCISDRLMSRTYPIREKVEFDAAGVRIGESTARNVMNTFLSATVISVLTTVVTNNATMQIVASLLVILFSTATMSYAGVVLLLRQQISILK